MANDEWSKIWGFREWRITNGEWRTMVIVFSVEWRAANEWKVNECRVLARTQVQLEFKLKLIGKFGSPSRLALISKAEWTYY